MTTLVPDRALDRSLTRMRTPVLTLGGLALATLALHLRDPHQHASWGLCPSAMIGVWCPGCGGLRAVNDLTDGRVGAAYSSNFALMVLLPFVVIALGVWVVDQWRGSRTRLPPALSRTLSVVIVVGVSAFTVLRNTPAGAYFAP